MRRMLVLAAAAVIGSAGAAFAADTISQAEMEQAFKGKTFNTQDFGETGTATFGDDGKIHMMLQTKEDAGGYRFANGGYCSAWTKLRTTETRFTAGKVGSNQYRLWTSNGKEDALLTSQ
jgi:hypothetical protein